MAVVSVGVLTHSLENSDLAIMQMVRADFTISPNDVSDVLASSINQPACKTSPRTNRQPGRGVGQEGIEGCLPTCRFTGPT